MIRWRTTNYLLVALRYLTFSYLKITWRLNLERGPRAIQSDPSMACVAEHEERLIETDIIRSWPLKICPSWHGGMVPPLSFMYPTFGDAPAPCLVSFTAVRGPEDMLSSPLGQHILSYEPPRGFIIPPFSMYDGSSDPYNHMLQFNQAMILRVGNDRLLCKVFPANLKGPALDWFHKLPRGSINSFSELWATFVSQYLCLVREKGNISSLQTIFKREDESI